MSVIPPRLAATFAARAQEAARNHERAPIAAEFVQAFREAFGPVEVLFVSEGDFRKGRRDDSVGYVPCLDYLNAGERKGKRR